MKIVSVVGARPNFTKIAPLVAQMRRYPEFESILVHTGQHYDENMSQVFFKDLGIPTPDYNLEVGSGNHTYQTAHVMLALDVLLQELRPDLVLVVGDVNSTLAATLVASKMSIPIAHVEAGLRSSDRTMPEEINRILTDAVADYLFTTERSGSENLRREGVSGERIFFVGNVMIDTLMHLRRKAEALSIVSRFGGIPNEYALLTLHRSANVDDFNTLSGLLDAFEHIQERIPIFFPAHPRTLKQFDRFGLRERVKNMPNLNILEPQGYLEFLSLMAQARLVLTDSGGVQEETTILGVPCLTLRDNTERPVTVSQGTNEIVGTSSQQIIEAAWRVLDGGGKNGHVPDLWDGRAAERIVTILHDKLSKRP